VTTLSKMRHKKIFALTANAADADGFLSGDDVILIVGIYLSGNGTNLAFDERRGKALLAGMRVDELIRGVINSRSNQNEEFQKHGED